MAFSLLFGPELLGEYISALCLRYRYTITVNRAILSRNNQKVDTPP